MNVRLISVIMGRVMIKLMDITVSVIEAMKDQYAVKVRFSSL